MSTALFGLHHQLTFFVSTIQLPETQTAQPKYNNQRQQHTEPAWYKQATAELELQDILPTFSLTTLFAAGANLMIKILIVVCLLGIVASLGAGMFHLVKDKGDSKRMANALTVRVALSVALFVLLFIAWKQGLIQPHGISK
jgi:hypothetical protein